MENNTTFDDPHANSTDVGWAFSVMQNIDALHPAPLTNHPQPINELDETDSMAPGQAVGHLVPESEFHEPTDLW